MTNNHHWTGLLLLAFALLILISAILITVAQVKVNGFTETKNGNTKLKNASNYLLASYILGYIATGIGIVLAIVYFGHGALNFPSELPHLILFIVLFLLVIVSIVLAFIGLSDINNANPVNKTQSTNYIWGGIGLAIASIVVLLISGVWRSIHNSNTKVVNVPGKVETVTKVHTENKPTDILPPAHMAPTLTTSSVVTPTLSVEHHVVSPTLSVEHHYIPASTALVHQSTPSMVQVPTAYATVPPPLPGQVIIPSSTGSTYTVV